MIKEFIKILEDNKELFSLIVLTTTNVNYTL